MSGLFQQWMARLGVADRVPVGWEQAIQSDPHERVLIDAGFDYVGRFEFEVAQTWTVQSLIGFAYSTSFLNREVLGGQRVAFERELAELLRSHRPDGVFLQPARYAYQLARRPPG